MNIETIRELALSWPGVEEGISYGTPVFKANGKILARIHEDGKSLVLKMDMDTREIVLQVHPEAFYLTDHYRKYQYVLVRLSSIHPDELRGYLEKAWRSCSQKRILTAYDRDIKDS